MLLEVLIALMVIALILPVVSSVLSSTLRGGARVQNKLFEINETLFVYERLQKDLSGATLKKRSRGARRSLLRKFNTNRPAMDQ